MQDTANKLLNLEISLDHATDISASILLAMVCLIKYKRARDPLVILLFLISLSLMHMHVGCQQIVQEGERESLDITKPLCPNPKIIKYTRLFGVATHQIFSLALIGWIVQ